MSEWYTPAIKKYKQEKYDMFSLSLPKGTGAKISAIAKKKGMSRNAFIADCIYRRCKQLKIDLDTYELEDSADS